MARSFQVLSVGYDRSLMKSRSLLLRNVGYVVTEAHSRHQALAQVRANPVDVMLICHTVPEAEKRALLSAVRKQRLLVSILCISGSDFLFSGGEGFTVVSNAPAELLAAIDAAVKEAPGRPGA